MSDDKRVYAWLNHVEDLLESSVPQGAELWERDCFGRLPVRHSNNDWSSANQRLHGIEDMGQQEVSARIGRIVQQPGLEPGLSQEREPETYTFTRCITPTPEQVQQDIDEEKFMEAWSPGYNKRVQNFIETQKEAMWALGNSCGSLQESRGVRMFMENLFQESTRWKAEAKQAALNKFYGAQYGLW
jgi:hypothetical protein